MSDLPAPDPTLPQRGRWLVVGGLSLLALPVTFSFFFLGLVAVEGCFVDCVTPAPRPVYGTLLGLAAGVMGGGWAGLVPWAAGRPDKLLPTCALGFLLLSGLFALLAF